MLSYGLMSVLGPLVLGLAVAYAMWRNKKRSHRNARIGEAAAREEFRHPDSYDPQKFRAQLRLKRRRFMRRKR